MGRNSKNKQRNKNKAAKQAKAKAPKENVPTSGAGGPKYTVDQLIEKATAAMDEFSYELAQKFCQRALELAPDDTKALETSGTLLLEMGDPDGAKKCFGRAVEVSPDLGHAKYMYLGQLFSGAEAVQCFQKGIELMLAERQRKQETEVAAACAVDKSAVSDSDVSNAYCSVAELYMTDCCDDEGAEESCRRAIERAMETDGRNPEAFQLMASFLLVKQDTESARDMIRKSVSLWLPKVKEMDKPSVGDGAAAGTSAGAVAGAVAGTSAGAGDEEFNPVQPVPLSYQTRIQTSQILTEVEDYDAACEVLEGLLDEDDSVVEVWHLLGWASYRQGTDYYHNAHHYLNKAKQVLVSSGDPDTEMKQHIEDLLEKIGPGYAGEEDAEETMNGDEADDDEEYETDSEEEMEQS